MPEHSSDSRSSAVEDFGVHLTRFLEDLTAAGYAVKTLRDKRGLVAPFIRWASDHGIATSDLDETRVDAFLSNPSRARYNHRTAREQFVAHLRVTEAAPPRRREQLPGETLVQKYLDYLRDARELSPHSLAAYSPAIRSFVAAQGLPESAEAIDALAVRTHATATWVRKASRQAG